MDERLLVQATPKLLEGWCGPVVLCGPFGSIDETVALNGRILALCGSEWHDPSEYDGVAVVRLDISRAECRDRVLRVVVEAVAFLGATHGDQWVEETERRLGRYDDLDPNDDTRLPDGSRLVDALALAAVAREVLVG